MNEQSYDAVIVGGGPAGLTAALTLAQAGAAVALIEESAELGGQYYRRRQGAVLAQYGDHRPAGSALIAAVRAAGVQCLTETLVWGAEDGVLLTSRLPDGAIGRIRGRAIVLATGAYERSVPFPGWTLPGVYTPGCALHLAHVDRVRVGARVVVAGSGPFLLPAACALLDVGAEVACILELNTPYRRSRVSLAAARHPARIVELAGYLARLHLHRVPIRQGWHVLAADGRERVERVTIGRATPGGPADTEELTVDAVCAGYGFRPSAELARLLDCICTIDPASGDLVPVTDAFGRTSRRAVYVAGEAMGIAGVHAARVRGLLAAYAVCADLGLRRPSRSAVRHARRVARRLASFTRLTTALYPLPDWLYQAIPDHTTVCRCECVTAGEIREASIASAHDIHAVKGCTRAGMGLCQGRQCGNTVAALSGAAAGADSGASRAFMPRMPIKPIPFPGTWQEADAVAQ